jgi:hypothetical protein
MFVQEVGELQDLVHLAAALSTTHIGASVDLEKRTIPLPEGSSESASLLCMTAELLSYWT